MLEELNRRLRDSLAKLVDKKDPSILESIKRWRAIENDIHGNHGIEIDVMASQATFLLAVLAMHVHYLNGKDHPEWLSRVEFQGLASRFILDDPRFQPYLDLAMPGLPVIDSDLPGLPVPGPGIDLFSPLFQGIFNSSEKHASGEHYTPTSLCRLMLQQVAYDGTARMLDPTCGAGAFIVSAFAASRVSNLEKDASFVSKILGRDLNPLAVIATRVNAWFQVQDLGIPLESFFTTIRIADVLSVPPVPCDLVIGNPPWVTLKDFSTAARQSMILKQAKGLGIAPDAHGVPQLELATVIFARCVRDFLSPGGIVFFVMTRSFMDGKHCSKFRSFQGLESGLIWLFDGDALFPKTFACLLGKKRAGGDATGYFADHDALQVTSWQITREASKVKDQGIFSFSHEQDTDYTLVNLADARLPGPVGVQEHGKMIPASAVAGLLPTTATPHYLHYCFNGATVFPQALLFIDVIEENVDGDPTLVRIAPALDLHAKKPWNIQFYNSAVVERRYLFPIVKGSELFPFGIHEPFHVFLPLLDSGTSFSFDADGMQSASTARGAAHFRAIDHAYKQTCKNLERIKDLWSRVNFDNELANPAMAKPFKIIIPDCGSTMAAALVGKDVIVEHALHYIGLDNEQEARYLLGILNAPCIEKDLLLRKSERHIGQIALSYAIPRFNPSDTLHVSISALATDLEQAAGLLVEIIVASIKTANAGKLQCRGCKIFVSRDATADHAKTCKKIAGISSPVDASRAFIANGGANTTSVSIKLSRSMVKKHLMEDASIASRVSELDTLVLKLLKQEGRHA